MSAYVGTSGWAYPEWKPAFYPADLPRARFLEHYAARLGACEINATFYRLQSPTTTARWTTTVPEGFRYAVKAHRGLTHSSAPGDADLAERFRESIAPLESRLGAILIQLPPRATRDDALLERLIALIADGRPFAADLRHPSWDDPAVDELVASRGGTRCLTERDGAVPDALPPGPLAYVRLRADSYADRARRAWLELLGREGSLRPVLVFAKHEGAPAGDPHVGVGLASWLSERLRG